MQGPYSVQEAGIEGLLGFSRTASWNWLF